MRVIFFPLEFGIAHIVRSLAIAEELAGRGHEVFFVLNNKKRGFIKNKVGKGITFIHSSIFLEDQENIEQLKDPQYLLPLIQEEIVILKRCKPDIAVIDFRFTALISCKECHVPVVAVTNSSGLFSEVRIPSIGKLAVAQSLIKPFVYHSIKRYKGKFIQSFVQAAGLAGINFTQEDLGKVTYLIPEVQGYLPSDFPTKEVFYVGNIWWPGFEQKLPSWLAKINPNGKTIYITFGGTGFDAQKLIELSEKLVKRGYRVIVSSSVIAERKDFVASDNLYVEKFLPGLSISNRVDLIVCHGGIGTLSQALYAGKPIVAIPFNHDQYMHAFRFQELGLGKCITGRNFIQLLRLDWQSLYLLGKSVSTDRIVREIEQVLTEKERYAKPIRELREHLSLNDGITVAADVIEQIIKNHPGRYSPLAWVSRSAVRAQRFSMGTGADKWNTPLSSNTR